MEQKNGIAATAQDILTHHLNSFGDIAGTMADYTAESRFFTGWRVARLRGFELGTDTFIVQNGKIVTQTFAGKISPKR